MNSHRTLAIVAGETGPEKPRSFKVASVDFEIRGCLFATREFYLPAEYWQPLTMFCDQKGAAI